MWIVMTSAAKMPSSCWGVYRRVAIVKIDQEYTSHDYRPKMISRRAKGVLKVRDFGRFHVGKTDRCAYARALASAEESAHKLNNTMPAAEGELLVSFGSA